MERHGARHRIQETRPAQEETPGGGTRTLYPWTSSGQSDTHSYTYDRALALSVGRHPSGGYTAEVSNSFGGHDEDPDRYTAGPFRTPFRAQVAAEALGERTTNSDLPSPEGYRKSRYEW